MATAGDLLSLEDFERWIPFTTAYQTLHSKIGFQAARDEISNRLAIGSLQASARLSVWEHQNHALEDRNREVLSRLLWTKSQALADLDLIWKTSSRVFKIRHHSGRILATSCEGIRLEPEGLHMILADAGKDITVSTVPPPVALPNKGGRPRKAYWEDAIVEMFDRIFHGTFNPQTQAEIEVAMASWILTKHGEEASDSSIRLRASKVFKVHKKEG